MSMKFTVSTPVYYCKTQDIEEGGEENDLVIWEENKDEIQPSSDQWIQEINSARREGMK